MFFMLNAKNLLLLIKEYCYRSLFIFQFKIHKAFSYGIIVIVVRSHKTPLTQITIESNELFPKYNQVEIKKEKQEKGLKLMSVYM